MSKTFSMWAEATDENGAKHIVTMVGEFTQKKVEKPSVDEIIMDETHKKGVLITTNKVKERTLKYAFSICHPDDTFNEEMGKRIALRRLKKDPLGVLKSENITCLCEDQCKLIVFGELQHVVKNIDHYLVKMTDHATR